jgi:hypothetical protein
LKAFITLNIAAEREEGPRHRDQIDTVADLAARPAAAITLSGMAPAI